jgi:uncharacterized protein (TIGR04255 family)
MIGSQTAINAQMSSSRRPPDLPNFERPPINEVLLSLQFGSLPKFRSGYVGLLWERLRSEYPNISEQPALPPIFETFGAISTLPSPPLYQIETLVSLPVPRFWFEEKDGAHLLQIQQDRIIHNWRKREAEQEYPRYETIRRRFELDLERFMDFLAAEDLGEVRPNQCEITYINAIEIPGEKDIFRLLERITPLWTGRFSETYSLELENAAIQSRFVLRDPEQHPFGRTHVTFAPGILAVQGQPIMRLEITTRGKPREDSIAEAFRLFDDEREVIVRTFAAVTTPEMWEIWGRTDAK